MKEVPRVRNAPSSSPNFLLGRFSLLPLSLWRDGGSWWVLTPVQLLSYVQPVWTVRLVTPLWWSDFLWLHPWRCISWIELGLVGNSQLRLLVLGRFPWLAGVFLGCAAAPNAKPVCAIYSVLVIISTRCTFRHTPRFYNTNTAFPQTNQYKLISYYLVGFTQIFISMGVGKSTRNP